MSKASIIKSATVTDANEAVKNQYSNIHKLPFLSIKDAFDIEVPEAHKKYGSGETWEDYVKTFIREIDDKIYSFHEFEDMLRSIHPNLFVVYNWDISFGHPVYFFLAEDFPPLFICTIGKGGDNEIPPESGFIGNQTELQETRQVYAGYKQALFQIKTTFAKKGIMSLWDSGNVDQAVAISEGK